MSWERKALEHVILLLVEKDEESSALFNALYDLGIEVNKNGDSYEILQTITEWDLLSENMEGLQRGHFSKEDFVQFCFEYMEKKYS